ncbi:MAG: 3-methyl-2-oxobutanoate hydroxymethyltransferase [bacterium]
MSSQNKKNTKMTAAHISAMKGHRPIVSLTAYDAPMAAILDPYCDFLLVGDSVGMVVHGLPSTVGVTLDMMALHGKAVMRGAHQALVVIDMPFGSYEKSAEQAFDNASYLMRETGAGAVKIESGSYAADTIAFLVARGIPVMAHVGLRPQAVNVTGGFKAKGRTSAEAEMVMAEAHAADQAGAFAIVVEGVDDKLAERITGQVAVPTIGIGASAACDGQILVTPDLLGLFDWTPKFVKKYGQMKADIEQSVAAYREDVVNRHFPAREHLYQLKK